MPSVDQLPEATVVIPDGSRRSVVRAALILLSWVSCLVSPARAQSGEDSLLKFRALLRTGTWIEGTSGRLTPTEFRGRLSSGHDTIISKTDLRAIDVSTGSEAGKGAVIGATVLGTFALSLGLDIAANSTSATGETGQIIGFTAGGALVGALIGAVIGSNYDSWRHVALTASPSSSAGLRAGLGLRYTILLP